MRVPDHLVAGHEDDLKRVDCRMHSLHEFTEAEIQAALAQEGMTALTYLEGLLGRELGEHPVRVEATMLLNQL